MGLNCDISDSEQAITKVSGFKLIIKKFSKVGFSWDISGNWNGIISVLMYIYWNNMHVKYVFGLFSRVKDYFGCNVTTLMCAASEMLLSSHKEICFTLPKSNRHNQYQVSINGPSIKYIQCDV